MGLVPRILVRVGKVVQHPHASMQFLYRFVRQLNHAIEFGPQQQGVAGGNEAALVFVEDVLEGLWSCDADVHDGLQCQPLHVGIRQVFCLFVRPSVIAGNHLELGAPGQEVLPRKIPEVDDLGVMGSGLLRHAAAVIQGEVSTLVLKRRELRLQGLDLGDQGFHCDIGGDIEVESNAGRG